MDLSNALTFDATVNDLAARLPKKYFYAEADVATVRKQVQIVRIAKLMHWDRKPAVMKAKGVDRYCREVLDQVCHEIPMMGEDLTSMYEEGEEMRLVPDALGGNAYSYDDMYEMAVDPEYFFGDMSLTTFLLFLGFDIDDEEAWEHCSKRFGWPVTEYPNLDWGRGIDGKRLEFLRTKVSPEMFAALRITILPPDNYFFVGDPENPIDLPFTIPCIKDLKKDLVEAEKLLVLADKARKDVEKDPNLLLGLVDALRETLKLHPKPAKAKTLAEVFTDE